ncbi:sporulation protein [Azospirillum sp. SYSU D00513]|uniref:sporulation protein n=1 Tax=Azospirillum sp. SYSU D00513 TaxID=2812561 RepID=UPI001A95998A|nr:sporulation protein [Azospirillum sp. SYSU D00513]
MAFRGLLAAIGIGGASVETVLDRDSVEVGQALDGRITMTGGSVEQAVDDVRLELLTRVEHEVNDQRQHRTHVIASWSLGRKLMLQPGQSVGEAFSIDVPYHTPLHVPGAPVHVWLRTSLSIPMAVDATDEDAVHVHPDRAMASVFDAMEMLGFRLAKSDVEHRPRWHGGHGYVQEFEFRPSTRRNLRFDEIEIVFEQRAHGLDLLIQVDRSARGFGGFLLEATGADESWYRLTVPRAGARAVADAIASVLR